MDISVLREFTDLARSLNYSATAKRLNIAQSTLSKHIAALEHEVGSRLFVRDSHSVRLTTAGKVFYKKMLAVLAEYDSALEALANIEKGISSTLNVGFILAAPQRRVSEVCRLFRQKAPDVKLRVFSMEPEEIVEAVRSGKIDIGLTHLLAETVPRDMLFSVIEHVQFGALVDNRHRLAKKEVVSGEDLAGEHILVPAPESFPTMARITSARLKDALPYLDILEETSSLGAIGPLVSANDYVALTYSNTMRFFTEGYAFIPLADIDIQAAIGALWKESRENAGIYLFLNCLEELAVERT